ncbi:MAG: hypothetical protein U5L96_19875 [Owenweeksia sp.]|nr:hypothetical protein [Owenweeksia sp.]
MTKPPACAIMYAQSANYLESWGDAEPFDGIYSLQQPTITPLFNTRQFEECLMNWTGKSGTYHDFIKSNWASRGNWKSVLHDGVYPSAGKVKRDAAMNGETPSMNGDSTSSVQDEGFLAGIFGGAENEPANDSTALSPDLNAAARAVKNADKGGFEIQFYQMTGMGIGNLANNPWLLEVPDPISRISWDRHVCISAADALDSGLKNLE